MRDILYCEPYFPEKLEIGGEIYYLHARVFSTGARGSHFYAVGKLPVNGQQVGIFQIDDLEKECNRNSYVSEITGNSYLNEHRNSMFVCYFKIIK